jgi:hypothetical protein
LAQSQTSTTDEVVAGRYRVEQLLGRGGMGAVYKVHDLSSGESLALKRLNPDARPGLVELLEREYCTLARLRHPRIVQVFEYGLDQGRPFYTMELLSGADLSRQAPMDWRLACMCLRDAASILGVLHARQLVHRDLNPRNLWQTPDRRLKLLDFGALTSFGVARDLIGTPAFIAPEALQGSKLDQRTDLFALGALGYWLLTGTHAFRAATVSDLPALWSSEPLPPSCLAVHVANAAPDIPAELDRLILSLLRIAPEERPRSTADLVNLIDALTGLKPDAEETFAQGYVESSSFVGREREQRQFAADLARASRGKPQALLIEGVAGIGRTRLLEELALNARIAGAVVATAPKADASEPLGTAMGLAKAIVKALPIASRNAAGAGSPLAAALFSHLEAASRSSPRPSRAPGSEARTQLLVALAGWVLELAKDHTLVISVDDFERADQESQAFFATLARAEAGHRLLVACTLSSGSVASDHPSVRTMRLVAHSLALPPLMEVELRVLLRSVFGDALYLDRMTARLHALSGGVPGHALLLARHLVRSGTAQYAEGAWSLPRELPMDLPASLDATVAATLRDLPADVRRLACVAGVADPAPLRRSDLAMLAGASTEVVEGALAVLLRRTVFTEREDGLRVATMGLAASLAEELEDADRSSVRDAVVRLLRDRDDLLSQVHCALHLLRGRRFSEAEALLVGTGRRILRGDQDQLRTLVPVYLEVLRILRAERRDAYALMPVLNVLAVGGNLVKRSLAVEHGDEALRVMAQILRFDLAARLKPWLGARLAFLAALAAATFDLRRRKFQVSTLEVLTWFVSVTGYTFAPATACLDYLRIRQRAAGLEPLLALGLERITLVHRFALKLALCLEDRRGEAQFDDLIARFTSAKPVPGLPEGNRRILLVSCYYASGYGQAFACDERVLDTAQCIENVDPLEAIKADHLRSLYHAYRGEADMAAIFEKRLERNAIEIGNVFQEELLAPRQQARIAFWTLDAASTRRAARTLAELAEETPSFAAFARWARAADLVLAGAIRKRSPATHCVIKRSVIVQQSGPDLDSWRGSTTDSAITRRPGRSRSPHSRS